MVGEAPVGGDQRGCAGVNHGAACGCGGHLPTEQAALTFSYLVICTSARDPATAAASQVIMFAGRAKIATPVMTGGTDETRRSCRFMFAV